MEKQTILISGVASGIGYSSAMMLREKGHTVLGFDLTGEGERVENLKKAGVKFWQLDITDHAKMATVLKEMTNRRKIDVLFNNAGMSEFGAILDVNYDQARYQLEVNLFGHLEVTKHIVPKMNLEGNPKIIFTTSLAGLISAPIQGWYGASKHALESIADSLMAELAPFGIQVAKIEPGIVATDIVDAMNNAMKKNNEKGTGIYVNQYGAVTYMYEVAPVEDGDVVGKLVVKMVEGKKLKPRNLVGPMVNEIYESAVGPEDLVAKGWVKQFGFDKIVLPKTIKPNVTLGKTRLKK